MLAEIDAEIDEDATRRAQLLESDDGDGGSAMSCELY